MKKIAIVGTSINLPQTDKTSIQIQCTKILKSYYEKIIVLSGGAKGVDTIAIQTAQKLRISTKIYHPKYQRWEYYQRRNSQLAEDCDELFCITVPVLFEKCYHHSTPQDHQKTAGCWTMKKALTMGKKCKLIVV